MKILYAAHVARPDLLKAVCSLASKSFDVAAAVMFNYILQITAFAATLAIDAKRMEEDRLDILWCVKRTKAETGCGRGCCGCALSCRQPSVNARSTAVCSSLPLSTVVNRASLP